MELLGPPIVPAVQEVAAVSAAAALAGLLDELTPADSDAGQPDACMEACTPLHTAVPHIA